MNTQDINKNTAAPCKNSGLPGPKRWGYAPQAPRQRVRHPLDFRLSARAGPNAGAPFPLGNATQSFSIVVSVVPASIGAIGLEGNNLIISGTGPANGSYTVMTSTAVDPVGATWASGGGGTFNAPGIFRFTNTISAGEPQKFYKLKVP